jgi:ribosome maturation factor RimP
MVRNIGYNQQFLKKQNQFQKKHYFCAIKIEMIVREGTKVPSFLSQKMIKKETILALAQERIDELNRNLFIVDLTISASHVIHLEIDSEVGSVSIDDCIRVSRNIEHNLDREEQDFELSVSSAGIDKPLRNWKQYPKNVGRSLKIKTTDGRKLEGKLITVEEKFIEINFEETVQVEGKKKKEKVNQVVQLDFDHIQEAKIVVSFK